MIDPRVANTLREVLGSLYSELSFPRSYGRVG
jgi:hypothetical protein